MARDRGVSTSRAGTKGVPRADREQQILLAACEVFGTEGYAATSVVTVADRAGISKPLIYQYFESKEGLFTAVIHFGGAILADEIERIARTDIVGLERGLQTLRGIFATLAPRPWLWRLFFDPSAPSSGPAAAEVAGYVSRITVLAEEGVAELMHLAGNDDALDISAMTAVWMSIVDALVTWWLDHLDQTADQMTDRCARLFLAVVAAEVPAGL
ncbi:TetR/AcrR family transcriptional regulator [Nocardioides baekrokdamisoli]|nr:TetR/AcrR family transcriptional regulator [Nocardioides baekrokdamisoli]